MNIIIRIIFLNIIMNIIIRTVVFGKINLTNNIEKVYYI